jgi:hypothetical protein
MIDQRSAQGLTLESSPKTFFWRTLAANRIASKVPETEALLDKAKNQFISVAVFVLVLGNEGAWHSMRSR